MQQAQESEADCDHEKLTAALEATAVDEVVVVMDAAVRKSLAATPGASRVNTSVDTIDAMFEAVDGMDEASPLVRMSGRTPHAVTPGLGARRGQSAATRRSSRRPSRAAPMPTADTAAGQPVSMVEAAEAAGAGFDRRAAFAADRRDKRLKEMAEQRRERVRWPHSGPPPPTHARPHHPHPRLRRPS